MVSSTGLVKRSHQIMLLFDFKTKRTAIFFLACKTLSRLAAQGVISRPGVLSVSFAEILVSYLLTRIEFHILFFKQGRSE